MQSTWLIINCAHHQESPIESTNTYFFDAMCLFLAFLFQTILCSEIATVQCWSVFRRIHNPAFFTWMKFECACIQIVCYRWPMEKCSWFPWHSRGTSVRNKIMVVVCWDIITLLACGPTNAYDNADVKSCAYFFSGHYSCLSQFKNLNRRYIWIFINKRKTNEFSSVSVRESGPYFFPITNASDRK